MKYFHLRVPKDDNAAFLELDPSDAQQSWGGRFRMGEQIQGKVPPLTVTTSPDCGTQLRDAIPNLSDNFIISERFLKVLTGLGLKNIQSFPIAVIDHETDKASKYWVCNVIGTIACIDRKRAKVLYSVSDPNQVFKIKKLAVDAKAVAAANKGRAPDEQLKLFRLEEKCWYLLADEEVEKAVTAAGIEGVEFVAV